MAISALIKKTPLLSNIAISTRFYYRRLKNRRIMKKQLEKGIRKLVIGADQTSFNDWLISDIESLNLLSKSDWRSLFGDVRLNCILAEHVWEHLTEEQGKLAAKHCYEQLKKGGILRVAVPDGNHPNPEYIQQVTVGGTGHSAHDHKELYTIERFSNVFKEAGFVIKPLEYFDSEGKFHHHHWNENDGYIRRSLRNDRRNKDGNPNYTSIILDAIKEGDS